MNDNKVPLENKVAEILIESMCESLNIAIGYSISNFDMINAVSSIAAMALKIAHPLTDVNGKIQKFSSVLKNSILASDAIDGIKQIQEMKETIQ